ncbi:hypothetical protein HPB50_011349 [Hyalomma asiaticum]|uniref:Uncharacterized protein n=1 Tax=Hyalomma asiaticum TaxID=266040 RepID=A0ACB7TBU0_HYAAI|nr:hypothetical protein HPB50_011349 [Hyalomma asiaticum]
MTLFMYAMGPYMNESYTSCVTLCDTGENEPLDPFNTKEGRFRNGTTCWLSGEESGLKGMCCGGECVANGSSRTAMASIRGSRARLTVAVLAGLLAPVAAAQGLTCTGARDIKFTGALEPLHLDTDHVIGNYGLRGLVVWLHGVFGAIVLPSNDPTEVLKEKRAELASQQYADVLWGLVRRNVIVVLVILVSLVLCVVLPLVAIVSIAFHRVCSCCKSWTSEYSETVLESRTRKKGTNVFYVLTVLMSFMTLGAIATKTHLSRASKVQWTSLTCPGQNKYLHL